MTLKTSLLITGDSTGAQKAVDDLARKNEALGTSGKSAAVGLEAQDRAQASAAASGKAMAISQGEAAGSMRELGAAAGATGGAVGGFAAEIGRANTAAVTGTAAIKGHTGALNDNDKSAARHAAGVRNLGQQFGDLAVQIQGGIDPARAFATQAGQMGYAMSEMEGAAGKVGRFLVGPWGIALTVATTALAPLVQELLTAGSEADKLGSSLATASQAADSFGNAQALLSKVIDLTTGALKTQNLALRESIRLQAEAGLLKAAEDERAARKAIGRIGERSLLDTVGLAGVALGQGGADPSASVNAERALNASSAPLRRLRDEVLGGGLNATEIRQRVDTLARTGQLAGYSAEQIFELKKQLNTLPVALNDARANRLALDALDGKGIAPEFRPYSRPDKPKAPPKPKSTAARDEFGRDAADRIAQLTAQFDRTPPLVRQVEQAGRQIADLMEDLQRRKPPGFEKLIEDARVAQGAIQAGINRPLDDFLEGQQQQLDQGALILQGRGLEAEALRVIVGIERQRGPLTADQRQQVLASTAALQAQQRQLEKIGAVQQINLAALEDMRGIVAQTIYEGPQSLAELPGRVLESFKRFSAERITEELFGDLFRDLRDEMTGQGKIDAAAAEVATTFERTATAAGSLASSLEQAATRASGAARTTGADVIDDTPIVSNGRVAKQLDNHAGRPFEGYVNPYAASIGGIVERIGGKVGGLFGLDTKSADGQQRLSDLGKSIGNTAGRALGGAFEGQAASGFASMLGLKQSGTGASIGGLLGGLLGGTILGGLFGGTPKTFGTAAISSADGNVAGTGSGGDYAKAASGLAGQVQAGVREIAEQLGGTLGAFDVVIGTYKDQFRVRTSAAGWNGQGGLNFGGNSAKGLMDFGDDEAGAVAFAILDAVKDGAVTGLSAAVQKAITSSSDVEKGLAEARKVQEVELLAGGLAAEMQKAFRDQERQAAERVRIAREYGFDVVAIEKRNADDRLKLSQQFAAAQIGSLQSLVDELTAGSLFEGSALERIDALNGAIAKAQADLEANVDGAADTLARLYEQRLAAAKDAYGTTGGFADTRAQTIDSARAAIAAANARITAAQASSDPALKATNAALDENNDQNAEMLAALARHEALLEQLVAGAGASGGRGFDLASLANV